MDARNSTGGGPDLTHLRCLSDDALAMLAFRLPHAAAATLLGVGAAQASDAITFLRLLASHGVAAEANPLAATLAAAGLLPVLLVAKALVVLLVVGTVFLGAQRYPYASAAVLTLGIGAGLLGATSNVLVLLNPYVG